MADERLLTDEHQKQHDIFMNKISGYKNVILAGHKSPDSDCIASIILMNKILLSLNPSISVFPFVQTGSMPRDCSLILNKYNISFTDPDIKIPESIDALILLDVQLTQRLFLPDSLPFFSGSQELNLSEQMPQYIQNMGIDIHCRDHHKYCQQIKNFSYSSSIIDMSSFKSTIGLVVSEFKELDYIRKELIDNESICTLGMQALRVDTKRFRVASNADNYARKIFGGGLCNEGLLTHVNERKITDREGNVLSVVQSSENRHHIEDFATHCHIHNLDPTEDDILGKAADTLLWDYETSRPISIVSAVINRKNGDENTTKISIRADENRSKAGADAVASLFKGGGHFANAAAEMSLGIIEYSANTSYYRDLITQEIEKRVQGSNLFQTDEAKKPKKNIFQDSFPLEELLKKDEMENCHEFFKHLSKAKFIRSRGKGRYLTLSINLYDDIPESDILIDEDDIPYILRLNRIIIEGWSAKNLRNLEANVICALVNDSVRPYVLGIYSYPEQKKGESKHASTINSLFGSSFDEHELVQNYGATKYSVLAVKTPLPELQYMARDIVLVNCINSEMKERFSRVLGERDDK